MYDYLQVPIKDKFYVPESTGRTRAFASEKGLLNMRQPLASSPSTSEEEY